MSKVSPGSRSICSAWRATARAQTSSSSTAMGNAQIGIPATVCSRRAAVMDSNRLRCRSIALLPSTLIKIALESLRTRHFVKALTVEGRVAKMPRIAISPKLAPSVNRPTHAPSFFTISQVPCTKKTMLSAGSPATTIFSSASKFSSLRGAARLWSICIGLVAKSRVLFNAGTATSSSHSRRAFANSWFFEARTSHKRLITWYSFGNLLIASWRGPLGRTAQ
mmetsp:Transcript_17108/g.31536  ORF Transcript_17108/g.31536 Transcript_17108/m.31536 type:complete len:222 (+) Transcript_17108:1132-1797(+)